MKEGESGLDCHILYKGKVGIFKDGKLFANVNEHNIIGEGAISNEKIN